MKVEIYQRPTTMFLASRGLVSTPRQTLTKLVVKEGVVKVDPKIIQRVSVDLDSFLRAVEHQLSSRLDTQWRFGEADDCKVAVTSERASLHDAHHMVQVYLQVQHQSVPAFRNKLLTVPFVLDGEGMQRDVVEEIVDQLAPWIIQQSVLSSFVELKEIASE